MLILKTLCYYKDFLLVMVLRKNSEYLTIKPQYDLLNPLL